MPSDKDQEEHDQFNGHRIPQFHCRGNDFLELREHLGGDDVIINKLCHDRAQPLVHQKLGGNEQRQGHQKSGLHFQVIQERQSDTAPGFAIDQGEEQEWQPGEQADEDDPPLQEFESRGGEPGTQQQLEQGPSQNEREIRRFIRIMHVIHDTFQSVQRGEPRRTQLLRPLFGNPLLQSLGTVVNGIFHRVPFVELVALSGHFAAHQAVNRLLIPSKKADRLHLSSGQIDPSSGYERALPQQKGWP